MKKNIFTKLKESSYFQLLIVLCIAIAFYMALNHFQVVISVFQFLINILWPAIAGAVLAYLLYPVVCLFRDKVFKGFKSKKKSHNLSVAIALILFILFLFLLFYMVVPQLAESISLLLENVEDYTDTVYTKLETWLENGGYEIGEYIMKKVDISQIDWKAIISKAVQWVGNGDEGIIGASVSAGKNLMNLFIALMFAMYMLLEAETLTVSLKRFCKSIMPVEKYARFSVLCERSNTIFMKYFIGNCIDSLIVGVMCIVFMKISGLPYALLITVIVAVTNFIPTFGPLIGLVICGFLILIVNPIWVVWFTIYTAISQTIDGYVIKPILFGDSTGLSPMWVLAAIVIFGGLFGMLGLILGVPLAAIIGTIVKEHMEKRLIERGYEKAPVASDVPESNIEEHTLENQK